MRGPYPIICRGHSGGRLLCEAYRQNNIWMGKADNDQRDAEEFAQANPVVRYLVQEGFRYSELAPATKSQAQQLMRGLVEELRANCPDPDDRPAYGWKRAISTFTCEIFMDAYPDAKTVHLVRDGRDVMLSRLDSRMGSLDDPINRLVVFGDPSATTIDGQTLSKSVLEVYRNDIEMHHWVTAVSFGMRAQQYAGRYLEVRYEDLCRCPVETMSAVFDFLDVPFLEQAKDWITTHASTSSIGKWKGREEELADPTRIGEPLLQKLGYV